MSNTTNPKSAESDTPRTDAQCKKPYSQMDCDIQWKEFVDFARQLERELSTCRESALREAAEIARGRKADGNSLPNDRRNACLEETARAILAAISKGKK